LLTGIDHLVIAVRDLQSGVKAYETLLDRPAAPRALRDGVASALIVLDNVALELMAPVGAGAERLQAALDDGGEGVKSVVFAARDLDATHRRAGRVGLAPEAIAPNAGGWRSFRAAKTRTRGVRFFFIERESALAAPHAQEAAALDHALIRSGDMEAAAALYGARLQLDMRLDRQLGDRRLMFFRCGDVMLEIAEDKALEPERDRFHGVAWRIAHAETSQKRLATAGLNVSDVREGAKPGTRVFTVRDGTCGVPTLMIEVTPKRD
jgi:catechol 2,3-dioxygenase-like lactoylglutathione lyase family enzyme